MVLCFLDRVNAHVVYQDRTHQLALEIKTNIRGIWTFIQLSQVRGIFRLVDDFCPHVYVNNSLLLLLRGKKLIDNCALYGLDDLLAVCMKQLMKHRC